MAVTVGNWSEFEELIAALHVETTPGAVVKHNQRVMGRSGRRRQLDITITAQVGLYTVLIVIECKRYTRPVGIEKVEAFVTKLRDVGASQGVMVGVAGFDEGAQAVAEQYGVTLLSYREMREADWRGIAQPESWLALLALRMEDVTAYGMNQEQTCILLTAMMVFHDAAGVKVSTAGEVVEQAAEALLAMREALVPGPFDIEAELVQPVYIGAGDNRCQVERVVLRGMLRAREYMVNVRLASGHVIERANSGNTIYRQATSEGFDWSKVTKTQAGRELSPEEFASRKHDKHTVSLGAMPPDARNIRIRFSTSTARSE
jgi:hypothetical protein